jgi:hypothetical protein
MAVTAGSFGNSLRSSSSLNPALTRDGNGTKEKIAIADNEVSNPLMISKVLRKAVQP